MKERLTLLIRRAVYNMRGGFLVRPLIIALVLGCTGAVLSWLEEAMPTLSDWVPSVLFPSHADPQVAQVILAGIASSIMTVVSIVFAILLMTLTLASMQFSPRIMLSFTRDRVTQWTLGIFLGTFLYCVAALPAARSLPTPFSPVATVLGAVVLALACVCWLLFFIQHIALAISVNRIVDRIATETEAVIDEMMPWPRRQNSLARQDPLQGQTFDLMVPSDRAGYIRFIDVNRLLDVAKYHRISVRVLRRVGHFIPAHVPLLAVSKSERLPPEGRAALLGAFDLGASRTLQQDVEFGVLQIVDIALRAISPAVNDPSTAISCVDQLSRILIHYVSREPPAAVLYDLPGMARVTLTWIDFDGLLDAAFEQTRLYSKADVAVCLRMLRALGDISSTTPQSAFRRTLVERGRRIVAGCSARLADEDLAPLRLRLARLEALLAEVEEESARGPPAEAQR
ncbi:MAG TPA: DUF2254 domain-containing protein [Steroidobacteraceae bacterium]|nr:DUF2254 domain-containing protein [Steroidobacteraceae bacterium]